MIFDNFQIHASPFISHAYCKCGNSLREVMDGLLSRAMFCPKCESVYVPRLVKLPAKKITKEWLEQTREEIKKKQGKV